MEDANREPISTEQNATFFSVFALLYSHQHLSEAGLQSESVGNRSNRIVVKPSSVFEPQQTRVPYVRPGSVSVRNHVAREVVTGP